MNIVIMQLGGRASLIACIIAPARRLFCVQPTFHYADLWRRCLQEVGDLSWKSRGRGPRYSYENVSGKFRVFNYRDMRKWFRKKRFWHVAELS